MSRTFRIVGMHCAGCVASVEGAVKKVPSVTSASVSLASGKLFVQGDVDPKDIVEAVRRIGYSAVDDEPQTSHDDEEGWQEREARLAARRMWGSWAFAGPIAIAMILHMVMMDALPMWLMDALHVAYIGFAIPVLFWFGRFVFLSGLRSLWYRSFTMDSLIVIGTLAAFITGPLSYFMPIENYAAIAAMIMAFHLTGRHVEAMARGRSSQAIRALLTLEAKSAVKIMDGKEVVVPIAQVQVGDVIVVKSGERIPVDGVVVGGESSVDESMVSGESIPVDKFVDSKVVGGTINQDGFLRIRAQRIGKDAFLGQIVRMVEQAQGSKVPIQEYADKVTAVFVPIVLLIAALTFIVWIAFPSFMMQMASFFSFLPWLDLGLDTFSLALLASIAVLVIACPCALGLATPTALMVSTGMGAQRGILIRQGEAIQTLKDARIIVFDKTGTITKGTPALTDVVPIGISAHDLLGYAASVEQGSSHPLALAIVEHAKAQGARVSPTDSFVTMRGKGIVANIGKEKFVMGNRALMDERGIKFSEHEDVLISLEDMGKSVMIVARDRMVIGIIALTDTIKEGSREAIEDLTKDGWRIYMVTGDNERSARAIASQVGIEHVLANVLPDEKARKVEELQKDGLVVFVGDGINDAPALKQANVGIAIGTGTDIAIESADVVLVRPDLGGVLRAVRLSRATFRKIRQNLLWAYGYNVVAIPLAIIGVLHPIIAEVAMAASSISVVGNANLLKRGKF